MKIDNIRNPELLKLGHYNGSIIFLRMRRNTMNKTRRTRKYGKCIKLQKTFLLSVVRKPVDTMYLVTAVEASEAPYGGNAGMVDVTGPPPCPANIHPRPTICSVTLYN